MSTLVEHLAALSFYAANRERNRQFESALQGEWNLIVTTHLQELIDYFPPYKLHNGWDTFERMLRSVQPPSPDLEEVIAKWKASYAVR